MLKLPSLVGFAVAASIAAPFDGELVGRWTGETFGRGTTMSMTLELFANGSYARKVVSASELGWSMSGDQLLIAPVTDIVDGVASYGKAAIVSVKLNGDLMVQSSGNQSITMKRVTWPVKDAPMLGRWEGQSDLNEEVFQDFTADGRLIITVTVSRAAGRYSVGKDEIHFQEQIPMPDRKKSRYRMQDGKLLLYITRELPPIEMTRAVAER